MNRRSLLVFLVSFTMNGMLFNGPASAQYENDLFEFPQETFGTYVTQGVAWADYDMDGYVDLYLSNGERNLPWEGFLYRNNGDGTFDSIATAGPIISDVYISGGCSWGDYNNDGYPDLYVANVIKGFTAPPNSLFMNNGDGTFSNAEAGDIVTAGSKYSAGVGWVDYDNDGYLDGFSSDINLFGSPTNHSLYKNNGEGSFLAVSNGLTQGVSGHGGFSWADFDVDGDMDVVTVAGEMTEKTILWINMGDKFIPDTLLADLPSQGASWGDYDNDGDFDLYITNHGSESGGEPNVLFRNDGYQEDDTPLFTRIWEGEAVNDSDYTHGSAWGDVDNDGDLDLLVANDGGAANGFKSRLYLNDGAGNLLRHDETVFADSSTFSRSIACADIDNDGDLDVMVGRDGKNRLFVNNGNEHNYILIALDGTGFMNSSAIGAVVRIKADGVWQMRDVSSQTGRGSQNALTLHFGLGHQTTIDSLEIHWTGSGITNTYTGLTVNEMNSFQVNNIEDDITVLPRELWLKQNFPNPFNPETVIRYQLPERGSVELAVYNALGRKVAVLVSENQAAGLYEVHWNASDHASGVYYCTLETTGGTISRKMLYIK